MMKKYDLIFSLGANCSAAHNLRFRGLRPFALPFDWTFIKDEKALLSFARGLDDHFAEFTRLENFCKLGEDEFSPNHADRVQYKNTRTGYYFVNHFNKEIGPAEADFGTLKKRFARLEKYLEQAGSICVIICSSFFISDDTAQEVLEALRRKYPDKDVDVVILNFSCPEETQERMEGLTISRYARATNDYDFHKTNIEWSFMDGFRLSGKLSAPPNVCTAKTPETRPVHRDTEPYENIAQSEMLSVRTAAGPHYRQTEKNLRLRIGK